MKAVLVIAGSDSCAGAGMQADLKAISAQGVYAATAITAITAQNTQGVQAVEAVSAPMIKKQIDSVCSDIDIAAVKIGLLPDADSIDVVADAIKQYGMYPVVVDPVMVAQSGDGLTLSPTQHALVQKLLPMATLITPNIPEAEVLLETQIGNGQQQRDAALALANQMQVSVLLKGGHMAGKQCVDVLVSDGEIIDLTAPRIQSRNTHGTGCSLASAIAAQLALGRGMEGAVQIAHDYVHAALHAARMQQLGGGAGPIAHFYVMQGV